VAVLFLGLEPVPVDATASSGLASWRRSNSSPCRGNRGGSRTLAPKKGRAGILAGGVPRDVARDVRTTNGGQAYAALHDPPPPTPFIAPTSQTGGSVRRALGSGPSKLRECPPPHLRDPHAGDFHRASTCDHALGACSRHPGEDEINQEIDREPMRERSIAISPICD
jgi:hypothetical protein